MPANKTTIPTTEGQQMKSSSRTAVQRLLSRYKRTSLLLLPLVVISTLIVHISPAAAGEGSGQLSLPFAQGETWSLWQGPHNFNGNSGKPWNSLDLAGGSGQVRAAGPGVVYRLCDYGIRIDHQNGWQTTYYHVANIPASIVGTTVSRGAFLGNISTGVGNCGGFANGAHVHFSVWKFTGGFAYRDDQAVNLNGIDIGGWTVEEGGSAGQGCMRRISDGNRQCQPNGNIQNGGAIGSGPPSPAGSAYADGTFLRAADTGRVYRVAGGAPLWLSSCNVGCSSLVSLSQGQIDTMRSAPTNGTFIRGYETGRVYRVVGGAPLWLSSCVDGCPGLVNVNQWTIDVLDHLHAVPDNGSFLRGAATGRVYRVVGGAPLWLSSCVDGCPGLVNVDQWTIDVLDHLHAVPDNGSFLRAAGTGRVYRAAGGAPLWLSSCVDGCPGLVNVDQWTIDVLDHLHATPDDGTLLRAVDTARIYQVNGGVPTYLSACPSQGCVGYVNVDQWTIDTRDHLRF